tara:strand:+ start:1338 stop:2042 length:705 start_codon:yes stop_codon:yes gene_type:complete
MCLLSLGVGTAHAEEITKENLSTEAITVSDSMSSVEKEVRNSAVRVLTGNGHGSGGLIRYKDFQLVLTANHVTDGPLGSTYLVKSAFEDKLAVLIYSDPLHDMSVLYLPAKFEHTKGIKWKPASEMPAVGDALTYSGYPAWHSLMTYRGRVAGFEIHPKAGPQIMLNTYGWFGCSGSLIYNIKGEMIGILWGVDTQRGQVQENMIWVAPIQNIDMKLALEALCTGMKGNPKACR